MTGSTETVLLVVLGAVVGAPARYLLDVLVQWWLRSDPDGFPWGTAAANLVGSLVIGVVAGATLDDPTSPVLVLVGTGFCGALTTFSALSVEAVRLVETGRAGAAAAYALGSLVAGVGACAAGYAAAVGVS